MYHPQIIAKRLDSMTRFLRERYSPDFTFRDIEMGEVEQRCEDLDQLYNPATGAITRPMSAEEELFVTHEINRCKVDYPYFAKTYCKIKTKSQELVRLNFNYAQQAIMREIGKAELDGVSGRSGDGVVLALLKCRQIGGSTVSESIISHRVFFYANTTALVAGHTNDQSAYLFDMMERIYDNLPWWMRPTRDYHVKDKQMFFGEQDSLVLVQSGKQMTGNDDTKGTIGTGKSLPLVHLSELSLWPNYEQVDHSLMPAVPRHPRTFVVFESTPKGRGNGWHRLWMASREGHSRHRPVFIGWYLDPSSYSIPAPLDWTPSDLGIAHAARVAETSPRWCGYSVHLTKDQLYWWERTRQEHILKRELNIFLGEFCSDDLESFQATHISTFPAEMLHDMRQAAKPLVGQAEIVPRTELRPQPQS